jgi:hypothetical protein
MPRLHPCVWLRLFHRFSEGAGASRLLSPKVSAGVGLAAARAQVPSVRPKRAPCYMKPQIVLSNWKAHSAAITYVSRSHRAQAMREFRALRRNLCDASHCQRRRVFAIPSPPAIITVSMDESGRLWATDVSFTTPFALLATARCAEGPAVPDVARVCVAPYSLGPNHMQNKYRYMSCDAALCCVPWGRAPASGTCAPPKHTCPRFRAQTGSAGNSPQTCGP